jgi:hypothetical protein
MTPAAPSWYLAPAGQRVEWRLSWDESKHPRDPDGEFSDKVGTDAPRLQLKGRDKNLTKAQARSAARKVVVDVAKDLGLAAPKDPVEIRPPDEMEAGFVAGVRDGKIVVSEAWLQQATSRDYGVLPFRQIAHEAMHQQVSGDDLYTGRTTVMVEEGAAEILSLDFWDRRGQEMDDRDAVRRNGKWTTGRETLAASVVYHDEVSELMRRLASDSGWDRQAIREGARREMEGDKGARLAFAEKTDPDYAPPSGYSTDAEDLVRWMLDVPPMSA